jgi:hypothetical protein
MTLNNNKKIPGMNAIWKQFRSTKENLEGNSLLMASVAHAMSIPTPPMYLAYRLTPKMEEYLLFMMVRF